MIGGIPAFVIAQLGGADIAVIAVLNNRFDYFFVANPEIRRPEDLRGKTVSGTRRGALADTPNTKRTNGHAARGSRDPHGLHDDELFVLRFLRALADRERRDAIDLAPRLRASLRAHSKTDRHHPERRAS